MSTYPASMRFIYNRLSGFVRNRVRQNVLSPTTANQGETIILEIPSGVKVDLSTITLHAFLTTDSATATNTVLVKNTASLIDNLSVEINGIQVCNIPYYNHLWNLLFSYRGGDRASSTGKLLEMTENLPAESSTAMPGSKQLDNVPVMFSGWLGFLSQNKILDTSLTGSVRISIRTASKAALITHASGTTDHSFKLTDMSLHYDVVSINDGIYDQMMARKLESGGTVDLVFQNIQGFLGSSTNVNGATNRVPCNCISLDTILHTVLPSDYATNSVYNTTINQSSHFVKGADGITSCQIQIGNTMIPQTRQNHAAECLSQTMQALGIYDDLLGSLDPAWTSAISENNAVEKYQENWFAFAARLNCSDKGEPNTIISGLDTRGANVLVSAQTFGGSDNVYPLTYLFMSSLLSIGSQRQLMLTV